MIKKIIAWITGKNEPTAPAPSIGRVIPAGTEASASWPFPKAEVPTSTEAVVVVPDAVVPAEVLPAEVLPVAIETAPVTVKAKYKKVDLNKMTKAQLMELVTKHGVEVKTRSTKEELVTVLAKV